MPSCGGEFIRQEQKLTVSGHKTFFLLNHPQGIFWRKKMPHMLYYVLMIAGVDFDEKIGKAERLQLARALKASKPDKTYKVEEIARCHGVEVLRLPPYHPDLNPIEMVWGYMKVG